MKIHPHTITRSLCALLLSSSVLVATASATVQPAQPQVPADTDFSINSFLNRLDTFTEKDQGTPMQVPSNRLIHIYLTNVNTDQSKPCHWFYDTHSSASDLVLTKLERGVHCADLSCASSAFVASYYDIQQCFDFNLADPTNQALIKNNSGNNPNQFTLQFKLLEDTTHALVRTASFSMTIVAADYMTPVGHVSPGNTLPIGNSSVAADYMTPVGHVSPGNTLPIGNSSTGKSTTIITGESPE